MGLHVQVLGRFTVTAAGAPVEHDAWPSRRAAQLVALLALSPHHHLPSEQVMDALWPELDAEAARANLHKAATYARQALGRREAVVLRAGTVALGPDDEVTVDAHDYESAARGALAAGDPAACAAAADGYAGDLLPDDRYEEWTFAPRDRLQRLQLDLLRASGRWADLVEQDPTDEEAARELMAEHHRAGRLHAAINQFQRLRSTLARELAVAPSPATLGLYRRILGSSAAGWSRPALVGREVELVRARAALRRATERRPAAILVHGPAGIGKTRVGEELVDHAEADGWFVLRAAATEESRNVPYGPLLEALEAAIVSRPEIQDGLDTSDRDLLARLEVAAGRGAVTAQRHTIVRLLSRAVRAAGARHAALLLDDLHLADEATLGVAGLLASAPPPRGMLVVAAYRSGHRSHLDDLTHALVAAGAGVEIALAPLSRPETEAVVSAVAGRPITAAEGEAVWALAEGNPAFASEVAASLADDVPLAAAGATAVLTTRLARVGSDAREALRAVALVTDDFDAEVLVAVGHLPADEGAPLLERAVEAGIVSRHDSGYRFRHDLVRALLTGDADEAERQRAHAAFGSWLAERGGSPGRVAHHLLAAGRGADALPFLRSAVRHALGVGAHADAVALADRALSLAPGDPELLGARADALFGAGDPGAAAAFAVAITASRGRARSGLAVRRARALILAGDIPEAIHALSTVTTTDPADEVQRLVTQGLALWCTGELEGAARLGDEARQQAEASGNLRDFVDAAMLQAMVAHERGIWPQQAALDLLDAQLRPDLASRVIDANLCVAESYLYGGVPLSDVVDFASDLRDRAARAGIGHAEAFAVTLLGEAHLLSGALDPAADLLGTAVALHRRVGVLCGEALSLQRLAEAQLGQGARAAAQETLAEALLAARGSPVAARHLLDRIHGTAIRLPTDPTQALAAVDEAAHAVRGPTESCPPCSINRMVPSAMACADAGDLPRAVQFLGGAEQLVAAFYRQGAWHAALDEARSHLARAEGHDQSADRLLRQAVDGFERAGQVLAAERCRSGLATVGKV